MGESFLLTRCGGCVTANRVDRNFDRKPGGGEFRARRAEMWQVSERVRLRT